MSNPVLRAREGRGLTRAALAKMLATNYQQLAAAEYGYPKALPRAWRAPLHHLGLDYDRLNADYQAWRLASSGLEGANA